MSRIESAGGRGIRWFSAAEERSIGDFWSVYDDPQQIARRSTHIDPEAARIPPGAAARAGDFRIYEASLRRQARRCAEMGVPFEALERSYGRLAGDMAPQLVSAYESAPKRLAGAFDAMARLIVRELGVLGAEYRTARPTAQFGDGVIATDERGAVVQMNRAAEQMVGWSLDQARGHDLREVFQLQDQETGQAVDPQIEQVLAGKVLGLPKHPALIARDGSSACPVSESMAPIHREDGSIQGVVLVFRDQNVERAHGEALEASQAQTSAIIEASLDAVITMDETGFIREFNGAAEQMFGFDREEIVGSRFADLVLSPKARDLHDQALGDQRELGKRNEMLAKRADGTEFPIEMATVRIQAGGATTFTCFIRDLTAAKRSEEALKQSKQQLRALAGRVQAAREEERTRIARELHDELGQQLTAIRMDLGWLAGRQKSAPPEVIERIAAMSGLVDSTFKMVRRLGTELRPSVLDDLGLAAAIDWQAREFQARSGIQVDVHAPADLASIDPGCATAIFRIFQEILTNVGRHSGARHVLATLTHEIDVLAFEVTDDGRGIREQETANLGSLGLLGMRERAALLGGTFRIDPAPGGGTVVSVTLPCREQP